MTDPIALWAQRYVIEEAIYTQRELLAELRRSINAEQSVETHLSDIRRIVDRLPPPVADRYTPWATAPKSFQYGTEAHYQRRILLIIESLATGGFPVGSIEEVLCARHIINPSAFNGTPRISRVDGVSFIIFPAPMVYWMYGICSMIAAGGGIGVLNRRKLKLYLRYIIASRSFERFASPLTAHLVDYLVDEFVHEGDVEDVDSGELVAPDFTMTMVSAVEDFVLCHELAHLILNHGDEGNVDTEAEADRVALEMLSSIPVDRIRHFGVTDLAPEHFSQIGYLTLKMWTMVRIAAERRALPFIWDNEEQVEVRRRHWDRAAGARLEQIDKMGTLNSFGVSLGLRTIAAGMNVVVEEIGKIELDWADVERIRKLARATAGGDLSVIES